jgi:hypothetical protein
MVSGVDRDPGETTARETPERTRVSTSTLHHSEFVFLKSKAVMNSLLWVPAAELQPRCHERRPPTIPPTERTPECVT